MFLRVWIFFLLQLDYLSFADHYKGGTISWKPVAPYSLTNPVQIIITERHSWTFYRYPCNDTIINTLGPYNDTQNATSPTLTCISSTANCSASLYTTVNSSLYCTDYSTVFQITTGSYFTAQLNLASTTTIDIAWRGVAWADVILTNGWSLVAHMDLTPISGNKINTSPVTGSLPIFQVYVGYLSVIQILAYDWDNEQTVRCRWSSQYSLDECGNVCFDLPNAVLNPVDCSITWTAVLRSADIANGLNVSTYVVAITAEDFENASSTTPLSSIPHQVLVYVSYKPTGVCAATPSMVSGFPARNLACSGISAGYDYHFQFQSTVSCHNDTIVEFISYSPLYTNKSEIYQVSNYTWGINVTWSVALNQTGIQPYCMASVDNHGQTSGQYCVMFAVGGPNAGVLYPTFVQSTASPIGTVMGTQTRFSIEANLPLKRTRLNGTYIYINQVGGGTVYTIDCKYSPDVYFLNTTLVFFVVNPPWVLGASYYITMTPGVATADYYCGTESGGFYGSWVFTIWNPALSSTTTPSTTTSTATTHTVTSRGPSTTPINTLSTTTGISAYVRTTTTSTTSTSSTSSTSTTTTTATTTTTTTTTTTEYIPDVNVLYPKDMENDCLLPITLLTILMYLAVIALHFYAMISLFVRMNKHFQNEILRARNQRHISLPSVDEDEEEEEEEDDEDDEEEEQESDDNDDDDDEEEDDDEDAEVETLV